ncbi:hypothetical protein B0H10DRAFT_1293807 [Mycena sp. CBHHK59/15]|nr:hypothetical protein B0H10DRAFT_1293807 [Mycena sp. CBHHK59/15]
MLHTRGPSDMVRSFALILSLSRGCAVLCPVFLLSSSSIHTVLSLTHFHRPCVSSGHLQGRTEYWLNTVHLRDAPESYRSMFVSNVLPNAAGETSRTTAYSQR